MNYETLFAETEQKYGLPAGYLARTAQIESSYDPNAHNKDSGAAGLFQFIPTTAQSYGLSNPYDPYASTDAAGRLARDNMAHLRNALGREPTAAELYVAHQQGAAGAAKLLTNPGEIVGGAEITLNGGSDGQTGGSFAQQWIDKFNNGTPGGTPQYFGEIEDDAPTWDPTTYLGVDGAAPPTDWDRISIEEQHPEAFSNWFEKVGANYESAGITAHLSNWFSEGADDPDFTPDQVFSVEGLKQYPDFYHDYLLGSSSAENAKTRIQWVEEDMVRQARLAQDPSITAALAAGVVDPVPLVVGVLTGGLGYMAEGGILARAAAGAAASAAVNAGTDYAAAQITDDPYADPVMAGIVGGALGAVGGALTRGARPLPEAQIAYDAADRVVRRVPEADYSDAHLKSVGAAQNPLVMDSLGGKDADYLTAMSDEAVPTGYGQISIPGTDKTVNLDVSVTGQMVQAKNPFTRLLGMNLFEPAAGVSKYAVTPDSASVRQKALYRRFTGNFMYEYHPALMGYLKEQGIGRMNVAARQRASKEFARAVRGVVESPEENIDANPFVKQAAAAFQKGMAGWAKEIGESGMADLDVNPRYFPKMASHERITDLDVRFQAEQIHGLIEAAILKHTPTLDPKLVARMAKGYWKALRRAAYGMDDAIDRAIRMGDLEGFKKAMAEALEGSDRLSDDELAAAWDALTGALESTGKAAEGAPSKGVARLKKRTLLDYNEKVSVPDRQGRVHRLSVGDMFEDDAEMVFGRYARSMSGRVAFAKMRIENPSNGALIMDGVKSEGDLQKLDNYLRESYRQMGLPSSVYEKEMENASRNLKFAWHKINGIPMFDGSLWYNRWARRIKLMQFTRLMSNMGLNQVQETWKLLSLVGGRAALSQMPSIKGMVRSALGDRIVGDKLLEELTHTTGLGLDGLHERLTLQIEDERLGSPAMGSFGRSFDNVLDTAADFTSKISLMRVIHDYQQRWALKAVTQRMVDMARAAGKKGDDVVEETVVPGERLPSFSGELSVRHGWVGKKPAAFSPNRDPSTIDPDRGAVYGNDGVYLDGDGKWSKTSVGLRWEVDGSVDAKVRFDKALIVSPDTLTNIRESMGRGRANYPEIPDSIKTWDDFDAWPGKKKYQEEMAAFERSAVTGEDIAKWAKENGYDGILVEGFDEKFPVLTGRTGLTTVDVADSGPIKGGPLDFMGRLGFDEQVGQNQIIALRPENVSVVGDTDFDAPFVKSSEQLRAAGARLSPEPDTINRTAAPGKWSFDMEAIPRNEWHRLASMGLGKDDAEMLFRNLLDNGEFDGKLLVGANVSKWDPEAVTKFRHFVGRYVDRLVQQNDHGALAKWMSNPVASMFTQFRSFVFGAWAKSTLWTIHHHGLTDPRMMVLVLGELAAGMATYAIRQGSQLSTEDGQEKFLEEMSDPAKLLANGWARTATASIAPMLIDTMLLVGEQMDLGTKPVFGNARSSGSALDAWIGSPVADQASSAIRAARGIKQAVVDGEEMSQSEIKSLFRALPLPTNYVPFSAALGALIQDRPEK